MGKLVDGIWQQAGYDTDNNEGRFVRWDSSFRDSVETDPDARYAAEPGRYRLYVSLACPWAHRTLIVRALKGLEQTIPVSIVDPYMGEQGWSFSNGPDCIPDPLFGARHLHELYVRAKPDYSGRVTVPVLWDTRHGSIVNNESADLLRMLNRAFDAYANRDLHDLYPAEHREQIDAVNSRVYDQVNNGVYKAGFATTQTAYEEAVAELFSALDWLETHLKDRDWLVGERLSEADIRLFTTLIRFDAVYHGHFKCNLRRIKDYARLEAYLERLYAIPQIGSTVNFQHIKQHYYSSHRQINPSGIVPAGPILPFL